MNGMKLEMSNDELRVSYNTAKNQTAQVQVLAELNAVTPNFMAEKLRSIGCDVPELPPVKQRPLRAKEVLFDENRGRALFADGKSDLEIAEMLGISVNQFALWRRKSGMMRRKGGSEQRRIKEVPPAPCRTQPPTTVHIPHPDRTAALGGHPILPASPMQTSVEALGEVLLDLAKRYPGLILTVNGAPVRALCLNVRVMMGGDETTSTLNLEVG